MMAAQMVIVLARFFDDKVQERHNAWSNIENVVDWNKNRRI